MSFEEEQKRKEGGERIQAELDRRIDILGHKPDPHELIEIVNDTLSAISTHDGLTYEFDEDQ